jgi:membrane fusion protein (multidrug efflux system)
MRIRNLSIFSCAVLSFALNAYSQDVTPVIVAPVSNAEFVDRVEALGTLRANESVTISSTVTELIEKIHFNDGQKVTKGQIIVEMDAAEELAQLVEEQSRSKQADRQLQRAKELIESNAVSESLLDEAQRDNDAAKARITAIQSRIDQRILRAPFDGITGLRLISAGALVQPGSMITTIDDTHMMKLDFSVPSVFLSTLKEGIPITAFARAFPEEVFSGTVNGIDSRIDPVTRAVMVRALIPNPEGLLRPGLLMRVTLQKNIRQALSIPEEAVTLNGSDAFAWKVKRTPDESLTVERVKLDLGMRRGGDVEVLGGLTDGDQVVSHGDIRLSPGAQIRIAAIDDGTQSVPEMLMSIKTPSN